MNDVKELLKQLEQAYTNSNCLEPEKAKRYYNAINNLQQKSNKVINKLELLLKDLKDMQDLEKETGKQYFNTQLFAIRVKEIYKILKEECDISENS